MIKRFICLFVVMLFQQAFAETTAETVTNEQVSQSWQQSNPGGPVPQVVDGENGTTQIKWTGSVTPEMYSNSVTSANGSTNTFLQDGTFRKIIIRSEVKRTRENGTVDYFQMGLTESDDKAVLSQKSYQVNNLQLGHSEETYSLTAGDIVPNFSNLSSSLGARGMLGQKRIGSDTNLTGYVGTVSESWEALTGSVPRNQYLRDTYGLKAEKDISAELKIYGTGQKGSDRHGSLTNANLSSFALAAELSSATGGFQYQKEQLQITGELAAGGSQLDTLEENTGNAYIVDSNWSNSTVATHVGYHNIDAGFATLSSMALPGITEAYIGADWTAKSWLSVGADVRNTKSRNLQSNSPVSDAGSRTLRATSNLDSTSWSTSLQNSESVTTIAANESRTAQSSVMFNYTAQKWRAGAGCGLGEFRNSENTSTDSDTKNWQLNIGNTMTNNDNDATLPSIWSVDTMLGVTLQDQELVTSSSSVKNEMYSLTLSAQRAEWGRINLTLTSGVIKQQANDLRTNGIQLDASHDFQNTSTARIYLQNTKRNIDDVLLESTEQVIGAQYNYNF